MAMNKKAAVFFKMRTRDGLVPRMLGIEGRRPQDDVMAVERAVALANRHRGLLRVVPHGGEAIRFGIEAGDSSTSALRSVRIEESKIRLQKFAVLNHVLLTGAFRHNRLPVEREERLDYIPIARKLREQLLTGARHVRWLILIVCLLRECGSGDKQRCGNPFPHGT